MREKLKIILFCFALSSCADIATITAADIGFNVGLDTLAPDRHLLRHSDSLICLRAETDRKWETRPEFQPHVKEAKRRKLTCGVLEDKDAPS